MTWERCETDISGRGTIDGYTGRASIHLVWGYCDEVAMNQVILETVCKGSVVYRKRQYHQNGGMSRFVGFVVV